MPLGAKIVGPDGTIVEVSPHQSLAVHNIPAPLEAENTPNRVRYYKDLTTLSGMNVDGSSTPVEFEIIADTDGDIYLQQLTIVIADTAVSHNDFGNISALTNGWDLEVHEQGNITPIISEAKTGGQVIYQSGVLGVGESASSWELINHTSNQDAQLINIDLDKFVLNGIRLGRGSKDMLVSRVSDNLTGLTDFFVYVTGHKVYS